MASPLPRDAISGPKYPYRVLVAGVWVLCSDVDSAIALARAYSGMDPQSPANTAETAKVLGNLVQKELSLIRTRATPEPSSQPPPPPAHRETTESL